MLFDFTVWMSWKPTPTHAAELGDVSIGFLFTVIDISFKKKTKQSKTKQNTNNKQKNPTETMKS